jgi:hypothetical protein
MKNIKTQFNIPLKDYFLAKGLKLEDVRSSHYTKLCDDLLESKIGFQYFKGNTIFRKYNLFKSCSINSELVLSIDIIDDVLPLFYINKLSEGHFKENKLVKELFEKEHKEIDKYISYRPKTYIKFQESSIKRLFEKLQYLDALLISRLAYGLNNDVPEHCATTQARRLRRAALETHTSNSSGL